MAKVVAAVGAASGSLNPASKAVAAKIQMAMAHAVEQCVKEGISLSDSETIKARMMAARELVKQQLHSPISSPRPSRPSATPRP